MRTKRRAIIKLSFILLAIVIGLILCFVPFKVGPFSTFKSFAGDIKLGADLKGGVYAVYDISKTETDRTNLDARLDATVKRLTTMVQGKGYGEAVVTREGETRIRVEVPDVSSPDKLFQLIGKPADMVFKLLDTDGTTELSVMDIIGKNVKNATVGFQDNQHGVSIEFDTKGADVFGAVTGANVGKYIQIVVDGTPVTTAKINAKIDGGSTFISGSFTQETASELAQKILAGAFDVKLQLVSSDVMSATLGADALKFSLIAGIIIIIGIIAYLCAVYRGMGLVSGIALLIYTVLFIFLLWSFPWIQLSLPGIAGIILSLGMAVDANVIIFERIKEEYRLGRSVNAAVNAGFKKSLWTVLDANITTILAALVLIILGTGTVRGFGITLLMGIMLSLLTAMLISRGLFKIMLSITKMNNKFYGLNRDESVVEQPDEEEKPKKGKTDDGVPFDQLMIQEEGREGGPQA